jgi:EAL domain-containing protein (putative c-di-GMP-specific phosphodiesterase class I)/DNA-binding NarL/FixJ family response regulator
MHSPVAARVSECPIGSLLIIDDSSVQRAHTVGICRSLGVGMIYEAGSGAQAIELIGSLVAPPALIIVDLEMPEMDGIELIYQLKQRQYMAPLIVASGREPALIQAVEAAAHNLGFRVLGGMQKPVDPGALSRAFARAGQGEVIVEADTPKVPEVEISADLLARAVAAGMVGVHYQPKVDMRTGIVRGVEALARWTRPGLDAVAPDRFIPLAEREGLIYPLTLSVMDQALAQAAEWNARGLRLSMAINLSPGLLDHRSLVDEVLALVARHDVQPNQVVLEITETSAVACWGAALGVLARLRLKGFGLSIDDYGTGFSSMQQLSRIPFTELKIDRSFVRGVHQRGNLRVILQSALDMARQLDLVTVAEGIETIEDWRLLQECGCSTGQGYFIGRPMPAGEFPQWLKRHQGVLHTLRWAARRSPA